jgi:hypothetical protein
MEKYRLYKFVFQPSHTKEVDWTQSVVAKTTNLSKAQDIFEELLIGVFKEDKRLPIGKEPTTGDKVLPNSILRNDNQVTLLKLHNPGIVNIWELNGAKIPKDTFPYSYIIIDNRHGIGQLAIQMKTDAWSNPDTVAKLLEDNLNRILNDYGTGLEIEIRYKYLPTEFFKYVKQRRKDEGVIVKRIFFEFTNPEFETPIETAVETSGHLRQLMNMLSQLGGAKAKLQVDAPQKKELIKRKLKDIKQMVSLVSTNGYRLKVEFSDKSTYTCDELMIHDDDMKETVLTDFRDGQKHNLFEFELFHWLDEMRKKEKDCDYHEQPIRVKPARNNKQEVS